MRKMRLDLDELVVEAFATTPGAQAARGTVRGHSGLPGCQAETGDDVGVLSYVDPQSITGELEWCICPREPISANPC
jgi:hypothetical protein